jgi:trehalose/maltose hydrolase-like predicted phosphorylase
MLRQRSAWARRWDEMGIRIDGDPDLQRAVNFSLFQLDASIAPGAREAPLGPRGLTGPSYKGHVFWDSEIFVLPFFAATRPAASRAMLTYRVSRLAAAQEAAREAGLRGAWFPWESAADGRDVTPPWVAGPTAQPLRVWTGERELHIVADVAWAAAEHVAWSGDQAFARGPGRRLLIETARFWASRLERDSDGSVHLRGIIGPDEYHELVDDNAYTNVMARWNLRAAAAAVKAGRGRAAAPGRGTGTPRQRSSARRGREARAGEPTQAEVADWLDVADRIVDGYDPGTRIYEQFAGFHALEPVRIADVAPRPAWADILLGRERTSRAQVVKQADVLMLHHLVPEAVAPDSLVANLDYYEPRTAHGSSLSPATHAGLLARAGRFAPALDALRMAAFFDLDDRNGTASRGLHVQTMGGLWQALVMGFAGVRPMGDALAVDPRLPPEWDRLEVPVRFRGHPVRVTVEPDVMVVRSRGPVLIQVGGLAPQRTGPAGLRFAQRDGRWSLESH